MSGPYSAPSTGYRDMEKPDYNPVSSVTGGDAAHLAYTLADSKAWSANEDRLASVRTPNTMGDGNKPSVKNITKPAYASTQSSQPSWTEQPFRSAAGIDTSSFASLGGTLAMAAGASTGVGLAVAGGGLAIDLILGAYERQKQQDELDRQRAAEANKQIREQQNQMRINAANARIDAITRGEQQRDKLSLQRQQRAQEFKQSISSIQARRSETQRRVNQTGR